MYVSCLVDPPDSAVELVVGHGYAPRCDPFPMVFAFGSPVGGDQQALVPRERGQCLKTSRTTSWTSTCGTGGQPCILREVQVLAVDGREERGDAKASRSSATIR